MLKILGETGGSGARLSKQKAVISAAHHWVWICRITVWWTEHIGLWLQLQYRRCNQWWHALVINRYPVICHCGWCRCFNSTRRDFVDSFNRRTVRYADLHCHSDFRGKLSRSAFDVLGFKGLVLFIYQWSFLLNFVFLLIFKVKVKVVGLHPTPDQGGLLVLSSLDSPRRPQRSWKPLELICKFAIASEGCVPAPAKASLPSMARLTQFAYSPCGNSEGMVYSFNIGVGFESLKVKIGLYSLLLAVFRFKLPMNW